MKYYSDLTKDFYNSEKECIVAEKKYHEKELVRKQAEEQKKIAEKKKQEERSNDAKIVETKYQEMIQAQKAYRKAIEDFVKKHGSYHFSTTSFDNIPHLFTSFFEF